jgi:hypothetical protein
MSEAHSLALFKSTTGIDNCRTFVIHHHKYIVSLIFKPAYENEKN